MLSLKQDLQDWLTNRDRVVRGGLSQLNISLEVV